MTLTIVTLGIRTILNLPRFYNTDTDILKKANFVKKPDKWVIKWNYKDKEGYLVKEEVNIYFDDKTRLWYYGNDVDLTRRYKVIKKK